MNFKRMLGAAKLYTKKELPLILTVYSAVTSVGAVILSAMAEKKALERIEDAGTTEEIVHESGQVEYIWTAPSEKEKMEIYAEEFTPVVFVETLSVTASFYALWTSYKIIRGLSSALATERASNKALESKVPEDAKKEALDETVEEKYKELGGLPSGTYIFVDPHYHFQFVAKEIDVVRAVSAANGIFECDGYATVGLVYYFLEKAAPEICALEGWTWEQVVEDWGEGAIPITYEPQHTKSGIKYFEISYNSEIKRLFIGGKDLLDDSWK